MKPRRYPCHRPGCRVLAVRLGGYCSKSCNRTWHLAMQPVEQRRETLRRIRALQWQQSINRMLQRVKVLADTEDARLVLAWRYGKAAAKTRRYRQQRMAS
jgi:hypothetical protein